MHGLDQPDEYDFAEMPDDDDFFVDDGFGTLGKSPLPYPGGEEPGGAVDIEGDCFV